MDVTQNAQNTTPGFNPTYASQFGQQANFPNAPINPAGGSVGGVFANNLVNQPFNRQWNQPGVAFVPVTVDPTLALWAQQQQHAQWNPWINAAQVTGWNPYGGAVGSVFGNPVTNWQAGNFTQPGRFLPLTVDPTTAAWYAQQGGQPQGWIGNNAGVFGQPYGGVVGSVFGTPVTNWQIGYPQQLGQVSPQGAWGNVGNPFNQPWTNQAGTFAGPQNPWNQGGTSQWQPNPWQQFGATGNWQSNPWSQWGTVGQFNRVAPFNPGSWANTPWNCAF
jgi:hypothetical protein